jgi:hypothetical protein
MAVKFLRSGQKWFCPAEVFKKMFHVKRCRGPRSLHRGKERRRGRTNYGAFCETGVIS